MRVAIATVQVPFITGGAILLAEGLHRAIAARDIPVQTVTLPFRFGPPAQVERSMRVWEEEDYTHLNYYEPDRVICLMFPSYGLRHPSKVAWMLHQHRACYDLFDEARASPEERALRERVHDFDRRHLAAIEGRFTISRRVTERLSDSVGLSSEPLYHPPPAADRCYAGRFEPYVLFPSRIESVKRQELLVRAMQHVRGRGFAVLAGEGGQSHAMRELAAKLGVADRVRFTGRIGTDELAALYANASAVCFTPLDEDLGYITLEAMLSGKPVITCTDSGGPLEFVIDGETGRVVPPDPAAIAGAVSDLLAQPGLAARLGRAGRDRYAKLIPGWGSVVDRLLA
ncbi:MAG: glycosyltransferase family 4 protein [Betaproteobacteria bacterium]|nr:glycosyltransferase family 4 protein [Betaproteobacteria bacterium]